MRSILCSDPNIQIRKEKGTLLFIKMHCGKIACLVYTIDNNVSRRR